ncbi:dihydroneopterin aldolase [Winogradskyella sp. UBA3174]|uniref:dihydroneopterin aldolase n=1 Tax=Winogradskyella sp. UBA3174 TaxID=1947785 RepID=UPI0025E3E93C|nr:dihydroneopterin aldolase [Winogradskyella sp. UBA3174]|tara:strand:- start:25592 stop:25963 length:372 start_codon:yes stop_codon:yes gene_type:complete
MGIIKVENIRVFANHGCLKEETLIGSGYRVDIEVKANLKHSAKSDELKDTVDYVFLNNVVNAEMAKPCKLLETVAQRIIDRIFKEDKMVTKTTVSVSKINPPIGGDVEMVTIKLTEKRKSISK